MDVNINGKCCLLYTSISCALIKVKNLGTVCGYQIIITVVVSPDLCIAGFRCHAIKNNKR